MSQRPQPVKIVIKKYVKLPATPKHKTSNKVDTHLLKENTCPNLLPNYFNLKIFVKYLDVIYAII